jgi:hypothetical protein
MTTKFWMLIIALVAIAGFGTSYWSYRAGVAASHETAAVFDVAIAKMQHECAEAKDMECLVRLSNIHREIVAGKLEALKYSRMAGNYTEVINEYLAWHNSVQ